MLQPVKPSPKRWSLLAFLPFLLAACTLPLPASPVLPAPDLPPVIAYDLGEAVLIQEQFPPDSDLHEMPVRLNGLIAVPANQASGPYPVVVILHGTHPGCPEEAGHVDTWPCDPAREQPNYHGFAYLVEELAAAGYVALSININAENTFGFGEPRAGERLNQLIDLHLDALAAATADGPNDFGTPLAGRVDLSRLAFIGHSRSGGGGAYAYPHGSNMYSDAVAGLLLVAPTPLIAMENEGSDTPLAVILPACDGDLIDQDGQHYFEAARMAPNQRAWATSFWLERANHNAFNTVLDADLAGQRDRPDCDPLLEADAQRDFLTDYAVDFLTAIFSFDPAQVRAAQLRIGADLHTPAPTTLYNLPARVAMLAAANGNLAIFTPVDVDELATNRLGGAVTVQNVFSHFCPDGFYTPEMLPGSEPCRRVNVTIPGQPALAIVAWERPDAALHFALPAGYRNLRFLTALSLRAAVDPLSELNAPGETPRFSIQLTDADGATAQVTTRPDEPALVFPAGEVKEESFFGTLFTGRVPLTTIRVPLREFEGVDLSAIAEIALRFDATPSGAIFLADLALVRAPIDERETLDAPPTPEKIAAAEAGDVEAMRQMANVYRPTEALGVQYGNLAQAVYWYRQACALGYANAQVDFYEFARSQADAGNPAYLDEAIVCLEEAIRQGHRTAIINGAFRAAFIEQDYRRGFFLYALFEETEPDYADQRWTFADQLTQSEIDQAEAQAALWRAENEIKEYEDFFALVDSPFRP